ncbi:MAG: SAM-dependent chlorinase/fluorinase [Elusimicrobia bacterium]|nr:SAM-dependent chlorinase/fluorinase [Elusimicrobiota bacterium]
MSALRPVVLLTDFGHRDPFVGVMKGVILSRAPKAVIVDLCHEIAPQDVPAAALALKTSVPYLPKGSIVVAVVDPGVGSGRRVLWGRSRHNQFLGPDNGIFSWLSEDERPIGFRSVENERLFLPEASATFHGRDVFAPVAAALSEGLSPSKLGPVVTDPVVLPWPAPKRAKTSVEGVILAFDRFGNAVTNLPSARIPAGARLTHKGRDLGTLRTHYAEVPPGRPLAVAGSAGLVELSLRAGDYAATTRARRGDPVHVRHRR